MRPSEVVSRAADYLDRHDLESPRETAEALLQYFLETDRAGLYARDEGLDTRTARLFGRALCQRCHGVPLQYLTGEQQFFDLVLGVAPGVFVPRPETEVLVEGALVVLPDRGTVVDVGTGTGAVALAIKRLRPAASVWATDVSMHAVRVARANASRHGLEIEVVPGDLFSQLPGVLRGGVDLVVANPPYVTREEYADLPAEVRAEPYEALVGATDVLRRLVEEAPKWLAPGGWLAMEIGPSRGEEVRRLMAERFEGVEVLPDLAGRDRVIRGCLRSSS
ncbi:MAG: peptide chain release factor N(5)-glutamine methyltransferase [Actinomycetota bacterium]